MSALALNLTGVDFLSHSKLNVFQECGKKFEYEYITKQRVRVEANHFMIGSACHKCIEMYYLDAEGIINHPSEYIDIYWRDFLRGKGLGFLLGDLKVLEADINQVNRRCRADYEGEDAIRRGAKTDKGEKKYPPGPTYWKNPVSDSPWMTGDYKKAVAALDLPTRMAAVDKELVQKGPEWANVSLSKCYAEVRDILKTYKDPECLQSVEYVEFPFSHRVFEGKTVVEITNPIYMPGSNGKTLINGYIDLVGRMTDVYGGGICIGDYKSSQKEVSIAEVTYHEQLNKYAWLWHALTGEWPTHLLINNLRFGTVTIAPFKQEIAESIMARTAEVHCASQNPKNFYKRDPFGWGSPCLDMDFGQLKGYCPHIFKCHPGVAAELNLFVTAPEPVALPDGFDAARTVSKPSTGNTLQELKEGF